MLYVIEFQVSVLGPCRFRCGGVSTPSRWNHHSFPAVSRAQHSLISPTSFPLALTPPMLTQDETYPHVLAAPRSRDRHFLPRTGKTSNSL